MKFQTNFLREREQRAKLTGAALSAGIIILALLCAGNVGMYLTYSGRAADVSAKAKLLSDQISLYEKQAAPGPERAFLARIKDEAAFANSLIFRKSFSWTSLLGRIEKAVPGGIAVTRIAPTFKAAAGKGVEYEISLTGDSTSLEALTSLIINLEDSAYFREVFLLQQTLKDIEEREVISFEIRLQYLPDGEGGHS